MLVRLSSSRTASLTRAQFYSSLSLFTRQHIGLLGKCARLIISTTIPIAMTIRLGIWAPPRWMGLPELVLPAECIECVLSLLCKRRRPNWPTDQLISAPFGDSDCWLIDQWSPCSDLVGEPGYDTSHANPRPSWSANENLRNIGHAPSRYQCLLAHVVSFHILARMLHALCLIHAARSTLMDNDHNDDDDYFHSGAR